MLFLWFSVIFRGLRPPSSAADAAGGRLPGAAGAAGAAPGPCGGLLGRRRRVHATGGRETAGDGDLRDRFGDYFWVVIYVYYF